MKWKYIIAAVGVAGTLTAGVVFNKEVKQGVDYTIGIFHSEEKPTLNQEDIRKILREEIDKEQSKEKQHPLAERVAGLIEQSRTEYCSQEINTLVGKLDGVLETYRKPQESLDKAYNAVTQNLENFSDKQITTLKILVDRKLGIPMGEQTEATLYEEIVTNLKGLGQEALGGITSQAMQYLDDSSVKKLLKEKGPDYWHKQFDKAFPVRIEDGTN